MNRGELIDRLNDLLEAAPERRHELLSELLVEVEHEWHEPQARKVLVVSDGSGLVPDVVCAWRVENVPDPVTYVHVLGVAHAVPFAGDHHDAIVTALSGRQVR